MVLDTHALVWWVAEPARLSVRSRAALRRASADRPMLVSVASVLEIATLVRRGRLELASPLPQWFRDVTQLPEIRFVPISAEIAGRAGSLGDETPGDPMDRVIVATALLADGLLVTADRRLRGTPGLRILW
jgi:PIN domain nuclease of toxin-antitoxin system